MCLERIYNYCHYCPTICCNVKLVAQKVEMGTLPILRAATEENLAGGEYFGPTKLNEFLRYHKIVKSSNKSYDSLLAKKLWEVSEKLTGFTYHFV